MSFSSFSIFIKGNPEYDTSNGGKKIIHKLFDCVEYKWCGGTLCLDDSGMGSWKQLHSFNKCKSRWDILESICRDCKNFNRSEEGIRIKKVKKEKDTNVPKDKKKCNKCEKIKKLIDFSKDTRYKDNLKPKCRICLSKDGKDSKMIGKVARAEHTIIDGEDGKVCTGNCKKWKNFKDNNFKSTGKYKDGTKSYSSSCRECINSAERERHKEKGGNKLSEEELEKRKIKKSKTYRSIIKNEDDEDGKICSNEKHKKWLPLENFRIENSKTYKCGKNKYSSQCKECINREKRERTKNDENYRILGNLRARIWKALKNNSKSSTTIKLLGCDINFLWQHLESQFTEGMTKENYGEWHVDHIIPCSAFDLRRPEEQARCFNWRNLQPLWGSDNLSKSDIYNKMNYPLEIELYFTI